MRTECYQPKKSIQTKPPKGNGSGIKGWRKECLKLASQQFINEEISEDDLFDAVSHIMGYTGSRIKNKTNKEMSLAMTKVQYPDR